MISKLALSVRTRSSGDLALSPPTAETSMKATVASPCRLGHGSPLRMAGKRRSMARRFTIIRRRLFSSIERLVRWCSLARLTALSMVTSRSLKSMGFTREIEGATVHRLADVGHVVVSGDDNDLEVGVDLGRLAQQCQSIHPGHVDVRKNGLDLGIFGRNRGRWLRLSRR